MIMQIQSAAGLEQYLVNDLLPGAGRMMLRILISVVLYLVIARIIDHAAKVLIRNFEKRHIDKTSGMFLTNTVRVVLKLLTAIAILIQLGVRSATLVAAFGSITVGLGLALQGGMANFAGGVLIALLKPFELGDYIITASGADEGTVTRIDIFYTTLRTADDHIVTIPNQILTASSVINITKLGSRRLKIVVGISYEDDLLKAKEILHHLLSNEKAVLKDRPADVFVEELDAHAVRLGLMAFTSADAYFEARWRLNEAIKLAFDEAGITIPYNQLDVHMKEGSRSF